MVNFSIFNSCLYSNPKCLNLVLTVIVAAIFTLILTNVLNDYELQMRFLAFLRFLLFLPFLISLRSVLSLATVVYNLDSAFQSQKCLHDVSWRLLNTVTAGQQLAILLIPNTSRLASCSQTTTRDLQGHSLRVRSESRNSLERCPTVCM